MAISYTGVADWFTAGTQDGDSQYKEITVTVAAGDLLVAFGGAEHFGDAAATRSVTTTAGTTSAWTEATGISPVLNSDCDVVAGWATVTSGASVTVRVTLRSWYASYNCGGGVLRIPSDEWTGTPSWADEFAGSTTGLGSVTISADSYIVVYGGADWSANDAGTSSDPSGGTVHAHDGDSSTYGHYIASWTGQTSSDDFGPLSQSGDWTGGVLLVEEPSSGTPATVTPTTVAATVSTTGYTERNASVVMGGASKQGVWV